MVPGLSYGIASGLEIEAGALIGYYKGGWLGLRYLLLDGAIKPGLGLAMPLFVVDGKAVAGIQCSTIVQWDFTRRFGIYASLGVSYFPSAASDLGSLWLLPGIGAQVRVPEHLVRLSSGCRVKTIVTSHCCVNIPLARRQASI